MIPAMTEEPMSQILETAETEFIDKRKLDELSGQAAASPRLRKNYNFHRSDDDACHRLLNAMEPGTYIRPHCHLDEGKDETLIVVRGRMGLVLFDQKGGIEQTALLEPTGDRLLVHIPRGIFHTWLSLQRGSVFFEAKAGPYRPLTEDEKAPWAPAEGDTAVTGYLASLLQLFVPGKD
jgi:cupin fold WbuC family metalloprotein